MFIVLLPVFILALYFIFSDKYKEPLASILGALFIGIIIAPLAGILNSDLMPAFIYDIIGVPYEEETFSYFLFKASFFSAIPEEILKYLGLLYVAKKFLSFDEPMDGIVYGSLISLGFAGIENIQYFYNYGDGVEYIRAFTAVPLHAACGAIMGYNFQKYHFSNKAINDYHFRCVFPAILLHFVYNLSAFLSMYYSIFSLILLVVVIYAYKKILNLGGAKNEIKQ